MDEEKQEMTVDEHMNIKKNKQPKHALMMFAFLFVGIGIGLFARIGRAGMVVTPVSNSSDLGRFEAVYERIESEWVNAYNEEDVDLETQAIAGFVSNLGDPYTNYFSKEDLQTFTTAVEGSFCGIGVTYSMQEKGGLISEVLEDTPAKKAGILAGDIIIAVDDKKIKGLSTSEVKDLVLGEEGTHVKISIERNGEMLDIDVIRAKIDSSVTYEIRKTDDDKSLGYLDINTFGDLTDQSIEKALMFFKENKIETIVIDLRDNTGGYLSSVQSILSLFVSEGNTLFSIQGKSGPIEAYTSKNPNPYTFNKGYVLVNAETASASEVMAGCLQETLGYQLVGTVTYGKGTAQRQMMLSDMTSVKYTYARWLLPSGKCINQIGLTPDIEVNDMQLSDFYEITLDGELKYDTVSNQCAQMQVMLKTLGYKVDRVDGYFSKKTEEALKLFEKDAGLEVNGIYDSNDNIYLISDLISYFSDLSHDACYQKVLEEMR